MKSFTKNQPVRVAYDVNHHLHAGPVTSAERPDRVTAIVQHLRGIEGIEWHIMDDPVSPKVWSPSVGRNCAACTFDIGGYVEEEEREEREREEEGGEEEDSEDGEGCKCCKGYKGCPMCGTVTTDAWNYVHDKEGDTTYQSPYTATIVERAATIVRREMAALLCAGGPRMSFALTRPPGHHACGGQRVGFCHRNFAIDALDVAHAAGKTALILDIDAHHGDGTETEIMKRTYGYYCSLHAFGPNIYPGTGATSTDRCLNIPLAAKCGDAEWTAALLEQAGPWIRSCSVDVIILSCGFDAHAADDLVPLHLSVESYRCCSRFVRNLGIPVLAILEGGYHVPTLGSCVLSMMEAFLSDHSSTN
jgi:acetoin utilization deacetylase AcuC-like enzyme